MKVRKELKVVRGEVNRTEALSENIPRAVLSLSHTHTFFLLETLTWHCNHELWVNISVGKNTELTGTLWRQMDRTTPQLSLCGAYSQHPLDIHAHPGAESLLTWGKDAGQFKSLLDINYHV